MLRGRGARGAFLAIAGFLRMISYILIDVATLIELVEYDLPNDTQPIGTVPEPVQPEDDEVLVEVNGAEIHAAGHPLPEHHGEGRGIAYMSEQEESECLEDDDVEAFMQTHMDTAQSRKDKVNSLLAAIKWLSRRQATLLAGLKAQAIRGMNSKLVLLRDVSRQLERWLKKGSHWPQWTRGQPSSSFRRLWATIRSMARAFQKKLQTYNTDMAPLQDGVCLMQTGHVRQVDKDLAYDGPHWWLERLQEELNGLKQRGVLVGAHVHQLQMRIRMMIESEVGTVSGSAHDRLEQLLALLVVYDEEASDETSDSADGWSELWAEYLRCFLLPRGRASAHDVECVDDSQVREADVEESRSAQKVAKLTGPGMTGLLTRRCTAKSGRCVPGQDGWRTKTWYVTLRLKQENMATQVVEHVAGLDHGHSNSTEEWPRKKTLKLCEAPTPRESTAARDGGQRAPKDDDGSHAAGDSRECVQHGSAGNADMAENGKAESNGANAIVAGEGVNAGCAEAMLHPADHPHDHDLPGGNLVDDEPVGSALAELAQVENSCMQQGDGTELDDEDDVRVVLDGSGDLEGD